LWRSSRCAPAYTAALDEGWAEFEIEEYTDEIKKDIERKGYEVKEVIKL
jgi:hypothetical protein